MLYKLALISLFIFSNELLARNISPELQQCMTKVLILQGGHTPNSLNHKRIAHGDGAVVKEFKTIMYKAEPAEYTKHNKAKSIDEAITLSKAGAAQYLPGINREVLEKAGLVEWEGFYKKADNAGKNGTIYKFVKFDKVIGYESGKPTEWLRVEWSSGKYHGHPIDLERLRKQCPECK